MHTYFLPVGQHNYDELLTQQSTDRQIVLHIILVTPNQPIYVQTLEWCMSIREATSSNLIDRKYYSKVSIKQCFYENNGTRKYMHLVELSRLLSVFQNCAPLLVCFYSHKNNKFKFR
jgi:hypothetical protein